MPATTRGTRTRTIPTTTILIIELGMILVIKRLWKKHLKPYERVITSCHDCGSTTATTTTTTATTTTTTISESSWSTAIVMVIVSGGIVAQLQQQQQQQQQHASPLHCRSLSGNSGTSTMSNSDNGVQVLVQVLLVVLVVVCSSCHHQTMVLLVLVVQKNTIPKDSCFND